MFDKDKNKKTKYANTDNVHEKINVLINNAYEKKSNWKLEEYERLKLT